MRALHIDTGREMRGGQWQALYLMEGLAARQIDCTLAAREGSPLAEAARGRGITVVPLGVVTIWREARRADIVHAHTGRAHTLAAVTGARNLVVSRRVAFPAGEGLASRWKYGRAGRFIAVSEYVRGLLLRAGVSPDKVRVVYDGVPLLPPARLARKVLAPATEDARKGSALAREAARAAGVEVRFSANLADDLREAGLFLYLSEQEGLGSGALLAMSAGVPVVASRVGGLPEAVEDGVTGLLVDNAPAAVAAAISRLMGDDAWRAELGRRARARVEERFTLERMVEGTRKVYEELL